MGWLLRDPWNGGASFKSQDPSPNSPSVHRGWALGQSHLGIEKPSDHPYWGPKA